MAINCKAILPRPVSQCCAIVDSVAISSTANSMCVTVCVTPIQYFLLNMYCTLLPFCSHMVLHLLQRDLYIYYACMTLLYHIEGRWCPIYCKEMGGALVILTASCWRACCKFSLHHFQILFCTLSTIFNHYQPFCKNEGLASFTHNCSLRSKQCFFYLLLLFCSFH